MTNKPAISPKVSVADDFRSEARAHADELLAGFDARMDEVMAGLGEKSEALNAATAVTIGKVVPRNSVVMPPNYVTPFARR